MAPPRRHLREGGADSSSEAGSDSSSDEIDTTAPASAPARAAPTNHEDANPMKVLATTIAKEYICPITQELPIKPVTGEDGKIYEEAAIREWFARNNGDQAISPMRRRTSVRRSARIDLAGRSFMASTACLRTPLARGYG